MKMNKKTVLGAAIVSALTAPAAMSAESITEALTSGKAYGDFRLRYESVEQDNALDANDNVLEDASALTLRSRLGYTTGSFEGLSATIEFEDSRIIAGQDEYAPTSAGFSTIADPETTELDQMFLQYKTDSVTAKLGRQVFTLDGQRHIGHVGWRQDRQTFDAFTLAAKPADKFSVTYAYLGQRNRIFAEGADVKSKDHLLNVSYETPVGKLVGYSYMLEEDNATEKSYDTYGVSFSGSTPAGDMKVLYTAEYASQSYSKVREEGEVDDTDFDAKYMLLEGGIQVSKVTAKLGYEVLGSDDGAYGFSTPLATLHKFNGWADQFLGTPNGGLVDTYASVAVKLPVGNFVAAYHDYSADEGDGNFGSEFNLLYAAKFAKSYNAGIKYASYSADDIKVDADKLWLWVGASF